MVTVLAASLTFLILSVGFILFVHFFNKSKQHALKEKLEREIDYLRSIQETENDIRDETLSTIGRELHDSVGQILTVAKIQLSQTMKTVKDPRLLETEELVVRAIKQVRYLAKGLNLDCIKDIGLTRVIEAEVDRFNGLEGIKCCLETSGAPTDLSTDKQIVIFRILQEFISNTLKHAQANMIDIKLIQSPDSLVIHLIDDGLGFNLSIECTTGSGLRNMKSRAELIGASFELSSEVGTGTSLKLTLPYSND